MAIYRVGRAELDGQASRLHIVVAGALVLPHTASAGVLTLFNGDGYITWQSVPDDSRCDSCDAYYKANRPFLEA